jgi:hypothetical protein
MLSVFTLFVQRFSLRLRRLGQPLAMMAVRPSQSILRRATEDRCCYGGRVLDKRSNRFSRSSGQGTLGIRLVTACELCGFRLDLLP